MANPTWSTRDFPVLDAVVSMLDDGAMEVTDDQIVQRTGLDPKTVQVALRGLSSSPSYLRLASNQDAGGRIQYVFGVTHEARRLVGSWPTAETLADALISRLQRMADDETVEPETRERAKAGLRAFLGAGRDVLVGAAGSALSAGIIGA
ncbi:hypothetical protein [Rhodococcus sp. NKCM2511]|uniref:hypothetical protein n=1 Tax=Rhodococcus sp. NKCM2511 TaxID=2766011 RepID=UPI001910E53B|nr:hypothetical protein [Rhodococcus sp. NKCM2511]